MLKGFWKDPIDWPLTNYSANRGTLIKQITNGHSLIMRTVFLHVCCSPCHSLFPEEFSRCLNTVVTGLMPILVVSNLLFFFFPPSLPLFSLFTSHHHQHLSPFLPLFNHKYHEALLYPGITDRFWVNKGGWVLHSSVLNGLMAWTGRQTIKQIGRKERQDTVPIRSYPRGKWHSRER